MSLNNNFKEENIKELLNIEADIAEKNISNSGLTIKVILFTIAGLIVMFLNMLQNNKFILKEILLIFLLMLFIYIFLSSIHGFIKGILEEKSTALIFQKQFSHSLFRYNPIIVAIFLLFYIFMIIIISLILPIQQLFCYIGLYAFFIPIFVLYIILLIVSYRQMRYPYSVFLPAQKANKKSYIYIFSCFIWGMCSVCYIIFETNFENTIKSVSYAFIVFAVVFLIERLLVIYSDNNISQKISDIRIKFLLGEIDTQKTARMLKFYVIGENFKDRMLNILDDILNSILCQREFLNTTYECLQNIAKEILEKNRLSNKKILESINGSFFYYSKFINYFAKDLDNNKKNINLLQEDAYSFNDNCVVDSPMTNIKILEEKYKEVENNYKEFSTDYKIARDFYEKTLKLIIKNFDTSNFDEKDNLDILRQKSLIIANSIEK